MVVNAIYETCNRLKIWIWCDCCSWNFIKERLCEKGPNTESFLVRICTLFTQWELIGNFLLWDFRPRMNSHHTHFKHGGFKSNCFLKNVKTTNKVFNQKQINNALFVLIWCQFILKIVVSYILWRFIFWKLLKKIKAKIHLTLVYSF